MMFDVGVGVCFCSALSWVGFLCLFSVWFVGVVSSVLFFVMLVLVFVALVFNFGVVMLVFDVWLFGCLVVGCLCLAVVRVLFGFLVVLLFGFCCLKLCCLGFKCCWLLVFGWCCFKCFCCLDVVCVRLIGFRFLFAVCVFRF